MSSPVEKIKDRLSIADVIGTYIKLEKAGGNFKARCPFHNEKTPSFFVSPGRNSYYCFGCGAKGDIFSFVEQYEGLDFRGALKLLAERAGVTLEREKPGAKDERERQYKILETATQFFESGLKKGSEAYEYLTKRGLTEKTIKDFRIGFAPDEWRRLREYLESKGFSLKDIEAVGLIKKGENSIYDRFRGRIIFPIADGAGRIVGFSGRILKKEVSDAKYLNSPETPLFQKSRILYGFDKAKESIRKRGYIILVEGQMDLIMSHQEGFTNTSASSGTALTLEHLALIRRFTDKVMLVFDADEAGFKATLRGAALALSEGLEVKMVALPGETDPADLLLTKPKAFAEALRKATHVIDFLLAHILSKGYHKRELGKVMEHEILPYIKALQSKIEQAHYVSLLAEKASLKEEVVWEELSKVKSAVETGPKQNEAIKKNNKDRPERRTLIERRLWGIMLWQKEEKEPAVSIEELQEKIKAIVGKEGFEEAEKFYMPNRQELQFEAENYFSTGALSREIDDLLRNLSIETLQGKFIDTMKELAEAERGKDEVKATKLLEECQKISLALNTLKRRIV